MQKKIKQYFNKLFDIEENSLAIIVMSIIIGLILTAIIAFLLLK
jgi:uncharacterized membrane protein (DUF106 family)